MARSPIARQRLAGVLALALGSALMVFALTSTDRGGERELATGTTATSTHPTVLGTTIERAAPEAQPATPATFDGTATTSASGVNVTSTTARRSSTNANGGGGTGPLVTAPTLGPPTVVTNTTTSVPATTEPPTTTTEPPTTTTEPPTTTTEPPTTTTEPPP